MHSIVGSGGDPGESISHEKLLLSFQHIPHQRVWWRKKIKEELAGWLVQQQVGARQEAAQEVFVGAPGDHKHLRPAAGFTSRTPLRETDPRSPTALINSIINRAVNAFMSCWSQPRHAHPLCFHLQTPHRRALTNSCCRCKIDWFCNNLTDGWVFKCSTGAGEQRGFKILKSTDARK